MTIIQAFILGIIQGITEFLPISSSAHLVLTEYLFGWKIPPNHAFVFDVLVQVGTLIALVVYFWEDLVSILVHFLSGIRLKKPLDDEQSRLGWLIIVASIPAGIAGVLFKDPIQTIFHRPKDTAFFLLITAALLISTEKIGRKNRDSHSINWVDAILMGVFQAFALLPGISRSGSTIAGGMFRHLDRKTAARFSFLMFVPIMTAAAGSTILDFLSLSNIQMLPSLIVGFVTSAVVGYLSIRWLLKYLSTHSMIPFAIYCIILSLISLFWLYA